MEPLASSNAYIKQIAIYFQQEDYQKAYVLARGFAEKFPNDMPSHFLYAKAAFWINDFTIARDEGLKAFNLSKGPDELAVTGIILACTYYQLKEYDKGLALLALLKSRLPVGENMMKLKFVFALALHDEPAAMRHLDELYAMNKKEASGLMLKFMEPK